MKIAALLKLTLLDFPGKTACTVFTPNCNFRCPFCYNSSLVFGENAEDNVAFKHFFDFLKKRQGILDGVCITGGEPLLQSEILPFIKEIKAMGFLVKLDTNGHFPKVLSEVAPFIDYVAMDIKSAPSNYSSAVGIKDFPVENVLESVNFLREGNLDFEFRTTAVKNLHKIEEFGEIAQLINGDYKYFIQNFTPSGDLLCERLKLNTNLASFSKEELDKIVEIVKPFVKNVQLRGIS